MQKFKKYIAVRLIALLMFPYSASAAAACNTQLDYSAQTVPDLAYESVSYDSIQSDSACVAASGMMQSLTSDKTISNQDISLQSI